MNAFSHMFVYRHIRWCDLAMIFATSLWLTTLSGAETPTKPPEKNLPTNFLKTSGFDIRDHAGSGDKVYLRGVNLGGWLNQEGWMCSISENIPNNANLWEAEVEQQLTKRFGVAVKNEIINVYQKNWITSTDLDAIASLGLNFVRVPFTYCLFNEDDGTEKSDDIAFTYLDWVVKECAQRRIYCLLDLHLVQGPSGQGTPKDKDPAYFWNNPTLQERSVKIWERVATRFAGNPWVAGYDLLNEPWSSPVDLYDRYLKAIRAKDPDHMIFVETWSWDKFPRLDRFGWTNVVLSLHFYPEGGEKEKIEAIKVLDKQLRTIRDTGAAEGKLIPVHMGEFTFGGFQGAWRNAMHSFNDLGVSWTVWTWKTKNQITWSHYNRWADQPQPQTPDIYKDSAEVIKTKWASWKTPNDYTLYAPNCSFMSMPVVKDDGFVVPTNGTLAIKDQDLLVNDRWYHKDRPLSITEVPTRTKHGSLKRTGDGWTYQVDEGYKGSDEFIYRAYDSVFHANSGHVARVSLNMASGGNTVVPFAVVDAYRTHLNCRMRVTAPGVLANDGDKLQRPLRAQLLESPKHGSLSFEPDGSFIFIPDKGYTGKDQFIYRTKAETALSPAATVTITITAPPPINSDGLVGTYFPKPGFTGTAKTRLDPLLDFTWDGTTGPGLDMPGEKYSVRWSGWISVPMSGNYVLSVTSGDPLKITIGKTTAINTMNLLGRSGNAIRSSIPFIGGQPAPIQVDFVHHSGPAKLTLSWSHPAVTAGVIPTTWLTSEAPRFPETEEVTVDGSAPTEPPSQ